MKVKELIAKLMKADPDGHVVIHSRDYAIRRDRVAKDVHDKLRGDAGIKVYTTDIGVSCDDNGDVCIYEVAGSKAY